MPFLLLPVIISGAIQANKASQEEAKQAKKMGEYNSQVAKVEADNARNKAAFEQKRQAQAGRRQLDSLQAGIAAAGGSSSPVATDLAIEQERENELDNLLIGYEGEIQARRAESQGQMDLLASRSAAQRAKNAGTASLISGFTNAAMVGTMAYSNKTNGGKIGNYKQATTPSNLKKIDSWLTTPSYGKN